MAARVLRRLNLYRVTWQSNYVNSRETVKCLATVEAAETQIPHYRKPWKIAVAVCLERRPTITKEMNDLERKFLAFQESLELEQSALSDYEVQLRDLDDKTKVKKKKKLTEEEEEAIRQAKIEIERIKEEEALSETSYKTFELAERETASDNKNDHHSVDRRLDESLYLVTKNNQLTEGWLFPQGEVQDGETLRQAAERILNDRDGLGGQCFFLSNVPAGVHTVKYLPTQQEGAQHQGMKVFFQKAQLDGNNIRGKAKHCGETKWLTIEELKICVPTDYMKQIVRFC